MSHQKLHNCVIPDTLTVAKDGYGITTILNISTEPITLDFFKAMNVNLKSI